MGTYTLNDGTLRSTYESSVGSFGGTGIFTQNGGTHTTPVLYMEASTGPQNTYNLNGGLLNTGGISHLHTTGAGTFNFNGGTLQASTSSTTFMQGITTANVQAGGAKIDSNGFNVTVAQPLVHDTTPGAAGDGGLTKLGTGTLTLSGTSTYAGPTSVNAGTLAVTGSLAGKGVVTVASPATLAGTGNIAGAVKIQAGGTFAPGLNGSGILTLGDTLTLAGTSTASFTLGGIAGRNRLHAGGGGRPTRPGRRDPEPE